MRVLVIDIEDGQGLDFAVRCADADHDVRLYIQATKPVRHGAGFPGIRHIDDWRASMGWAREGLIFLTGNWRFLSELDRYREFGFKIFASTAQSARLEIDRMRGIEAARAAGLNVPECKVFNSLEETERFARKSDRAWVFKPAGDESDKALTYVARDPADLVGWLRRQIAGGKMLKGNALLQEKIEMLCEIGISGWCGPEGFLPQKYQVAFEHKKLMDGEIGPATGEMGTLCQYVESGKLAEESLLPMAPALRALGHRGDFSFGGAIDPNGKTWFFEWTVRCGWPAFHIQTASHKGDPAQWMRDLLDGKDTLRVSYDVAIGVIMAQPRFPYGDTPADLLEGNPIVGIESNPRNLHCVNVMLARGPRMKDGRVAEGPIYQTSGEYVLVATGLGKTIERARDAVYRTIKDTHFANAMYRTDIGEKIKTTLPALRKHGYMRELD